MPEPLDLAQIKADHSKYDRPGTDDFCEWCGYPWPCVEWLLADEVERLTAALTTARREGAEQALSPLHELFKPRPDTPCRTIWRRDQFDLLPAVECVEVPMEELLQAFDRADKFAKGDE